MDDEINFISKLDKIEKMKMGSNIRKQANWLFTIMRRLMGRAIRMGWLVNNCPWGQRLWQRQRYLTPWPPEGITPSTPLAQSWTVTQCPCPWPFLFLKKRRAPTLIQTWLPPFCAFCHRLLCFTGEITSFQNMWIIRSAPWPWICCPNFFLVLKKEHWFSAAWVYKKYFVATQVIRFTVHRSGLIALWFSSYLLVDI